MLFEWDDDKRQANVEKHALDFYDAMTIWQRPVIDPIGERDVDDEHRSMALGMVGDDEIIIAVVYTMREKVFRLISARRARKNERKLYQNRFGCGC